MSIGYNKPLYVQPFDHRGSFQTKLFGWKGKLSDEQTVQIAASVPGFIGFAVGRTVFWEPLVALRDKKTTREKAVAEIARRYGAFADDFESAKGAK